VSRAGELAAAVAVVLAAGRGDDGGGEPVFPADYAATYQEVRDCRGSADHDLGQIRVLADPAALGPYQARDVPFPLGAVVLKAEYDFGDPGCTGEITQWTVMVRDDGGDAAALGWRWQRVDRQRRVITENEPRCFGCHLECGVPPDGYQGTCAVP
jgi:hypothetical protein